MRVLRQPATKQRAKRGSTTEDRTPQAEGNCAVATGEQNVDDGNPSSAASLMHRRPGSPAPRFRKSAF